MAQAITASGRYLEGKYGTLYWIYLEQAVSLLELTMQQEEIDSPIVAAVNLGAEGGFSATVSDDDDAFRILVQGALRILISGVLSEKCGSSEEAAC